MGEETITIHVPMIYHWGIPYFLGGLGVMLAVRFFLRIFRGG